LNNLGKVCGASKKLTSLWKLGNFGASGEVDFSDSAEGMTEELPKEERQDTNRSLFRSLGGGI
jgi:hypothetical protein